MANYSDILECYSLEEIFELNDLTEAEVLEYLVNQEVIDLPDVVPI